MTTTGTGNTFAGFYRRFGVDGDLASGSGYQTGYSNRNVFSIDLIDIGDESFFSVAVSSEATTADGYKRVFKLNLIGSQTRIMT